MSNKDSLGNRMKGYENISRIYLTRRCPVIIRIDGKAFHSFTRGFKRPFDDILIKSMQETAKYLCENIQGCKLAYTQSDEISLLLVDYEKITSQAWFENNLQKIVSIAASIATLAFNKIFAELFNKWGNDNLPDWDMGGTNEAVNQSLLDLCNIYSKAQNKGAMFDARAFILPKEEVCNYFIWRQQDATRNSIQMVAQSEFSHKELQGKNCNQLQDMLHEQKDINWNDFCTVYKRGSCIIKENYAINLPVGGMIEDGEEDTVWRSRWVIDEDIPIFTQDREYIEKLI